MVVFWRVIGNIWVIGDETDFFMFTIAKLLIIAVVLSIAAVALIWYVPYWIVSRLLARAIPPMPANVMGALAGIALLVLLGAIAQANSRQSIAAQSSTSSGVSRTTPSYGYTTPVPGRTLTPADVQPAVQSTAGYIASSFDNIVADQSVITSLDRMDLLGVTSTTFVACVAYTSKNHTTGAIEAGIAYLELDQWSSGQWAVGTPVYSTLDPSHSAADLASCHQKAAGYEIMSVGPFTPPAIPAR